MIYINMKETGVGGGVLPVFRPGVSEIDDHFVGLGHEGFEGEDDVEQKHVAVGRVRLEPPRDVIEHGVACFRVARLENKRK